MTDSLFRADAVLDDEVVVVTGGTRGIGRAITGKFVERGATVISFYYTNETAAEAATEAFADAPGDLIVRQLDVRDYDAVRASFEEIREEHGNITVLVNNAAIIQTKWLPRMDAEDWRQDIETNLLGTINCTESVISSMLAEGGGRIVNISSIAGESSWLGQAGYIASKAGVNGFTRAAARDLGQLDVRVNAVSVGLTNTGHYQSLKEEGVVGGEQEEIPLGRIADPGEIADCVLFLASPNASYINGEILRVDGGFLA